MMFLQFGLVLASMSCIGVAAMSWRAGYYLEIAVLRGLVVFMVVSVVAYAAELVVATSQPRRRTVERLPRVTGGEARAHAPAAASTSDGADSAAGQQSQRRAA